VLDQIKNNNRFNYIMQQAEGMPLDQQPGQLDEIELGANGEYVLSQNQIITSPEGTEYKIV
jgi:hypothetical protein